MRGAPPPRRLELPPGVTTVAAWRYPSRSTPGRTYDVAFCPSEGWSCECWPWIQRRWCAHVRDARQRLRAMRGP